MTTTSGTREHAIGVDGDADGNPLGVCALEAKRTLAIAIHRIGELIVSIPTDKFAAMIETFFEDEELGRKFTDLVVCVQQRALEAKE